MLRKITNLLLPLLGFLFLSAYIRAATVNVIYTDYTRLVLTYLENVFSIKPYMGLDSLTRMPINYLQRIVNVVFFRYSTSFDMILGALCLSLTAFVIGKYIFDKGYSMWIYLACMLIVFSLNKWEMLTNGSGWVHFLAILLFVCHFYIFDKSREFKRRKYELILRLLPVFAVIFVAGPYSVAYTATMLLFYCFDIYLNDFDRGNMRKNVKRILYIFIPCCLYMISRAYSVEEHAGATTMSFSEGLRTKFPVILSLFVKSFSSMIFGEEWMRAHGLGEGLVLMLSFIVIIAYIFAFYINVRYKVYKYTMLPLILLVYGVFNHILVTLARWIFLKDTYGMSSRYALQYHLGIVGIVLSIAYFMSIKEKSKKLMRFAAIGFILIFVSGNLLTTNQEIEVAKYRKENFIKIRETALNFEKESDATLKKVFQYHDGARTRKALKILKDRKLNVFK